MNLLTSLGIAKKSRVGILGGSFNPPHYGHIGISEQALKLLPIDYVIWLVAPKNPMKSDQELRPFEMRYQLCKRILFGHDNIIVSDFEKLLPVDDNITFNSLTKLKEECQDASLIWLMGADNLLHFHEWGHWKEIISMVPVAVLDRDNYIPKLKDTEVYKVAKNFKIINSSVDEINPGEIRFLAIDNFDISSTEIRKKHMQYTEAIDKHFSASLKEFIVESLEEDKAQDIAIIDLEGKADFADYMVVASGNSHRHLSAMADHIKQKLKHDMGILVNVSGDFNASSGWIAVDAFDIIIHLFKPEERQRYSLEKMWNVEFEN